MKNHTSHTNEHKIKAGKANSVAAARRGPPADEQAAPDTVKVIRSFNAERRAHEEQYARVRQASDAARHAHVDARAMHHDADEARAEYLTSQAEHPERRGPLLVMVLAALATLALDGFASYFAAESLGGDQEATLIWTAIFLGILGILEGGLALSAERNRKVFRLSALALGLFAALLALLRFVFFSAIGGNPASSVIDAALFTGCTILLVWAGFLALRYSETIDIWRARRRERKAASKADAADERATRQAAYRNRLIDAYLSRIRPSLLRICTDSQLTAMERAIRSHLIGESV